MFINKVNKEKQILNHNGDLRLSKKIKNKCTYFTYLLDIKSEFYIIFILIEIQKQNLKSSTGQAETETVTETENKSQMLRQKMESRNRNRNNLKQ